MCVVGWLGGWDRSNSGGGKWRVWTGVDGV